MDIKLIDLIVYINDRFPWSTYLNTDNDSFPKEYRFKVIYVWEFYTMLLSNAELSNLSIKSINNNKNLIYNILNNKFEIKSIPIELKIEVD